MDIAIIGAGNVGRALATSLSQAGHRVTIASRDAADAAAAAAESGARVAESSVEAVRDADVVIPAVYITSMPDVADEIGAVAIAVPGRAGTPSGEPPERPADRVRDRRGADLHPRPGDH